MLGERKVKALIIVAVAIAVGLVLYYVTPVMGEGSYSGLLVLECGSDRAEISFGFSIGANSSAVTKTASVALCSERMNVTVSVPAIPRLELEKSFSIVVRINASREVLSRIGLRLELATPTGYSLVYAPTEYDIGKGVARFSIKILYKTKEAAFIFGSSIVLFIGSSVVHYTITSIYLTLALYLVGAITLADPFTLYMSDICLVFLAGSALELVIRNTGLGDRIAGTLRSLARSPSTFFLSTLLVGGFVSMWMSNTSATYLLLPIVASLARAAGIENTILYELTLIGLAVGTTIGGSATVIGTPPNLIASGYLNTYIFKRNAITFNIWLIWGLPYFALSAVVAYATFIIMYKLMAPNEVEVIKEKLKLFEAAREVRKGLSRSEVLGLIGILILIGLWVTESIHGIKTGVAGMIGLLAMLALGVLKPKDIKDLGWDIVILMGGGLTLGRGLMSTGFSDVVTQLFATYMRSPQLLVWLIGFVSLMLGTFISSHTAGVAFICPIIAPLGYVIGPSIGLSPEAGSALLVLLATLALDTAVALPISTPPSAIVFGTGKVRIKTMLIYGMVFGIITVILTLLLLPPLITYVITK